jgi:hypothetical protein
MNKQAQLVCAWCGPAMVVVTMVGWLLAGILPVPPAADSTAAEVVAFYTGNVNLVRLGLALAAIGVCLVGPLVAVIAIQMLRMEGRAPILTVLQVLSGAVTWVMLMVPMIMLNVAAFRPERSPEVTQAINDLAWILFFTPIGPFVIQNLSIGGAILGDRAVHPVLPRWIGYANIWIAFLFCPAVLAYFFKSGPFAWHGIFVFWLGLLAYSVWAVLMGLSLRRAILDEPDHEPVPGAVPAAR